jgi:hypothetical protein
MNMKKILTFKEYAEFNRVASSEQYSRNVSFYDPMKGWVLDLSRKIKEPQNT